MEVLPAAAVVTEAAMLRELDIAHMRHDEVDLVAVPFRMPLAAATAAGGDRIPLHGLVMWFDTWCQEHGPIATTATARGGAPAAAAAAAAGDDDDDDDDMPGLTTANGDAATATPTVGASGGATPLAAVERRMTVSTSPFAPPTHWQQTLFLFHEPIAVPRSTGTAVEGTISMVRDGRNPREYRFVIDVAGTRVQYHMR